MKKMNTEMMMPIPPQMERVRSEPIIQGYTHEIELSGPLLDPEHYYEDFQVMRNAGPNDLIEIHINGPGGLGYTAVQYINEMNNCQATIVGILAGDCASAHTFIFLACDGFEVREHTTFMAHNYSAGVIGKGNEMAARIKHEERWYNELTQVAYQGFMTDEEISQMIEGRDFYFNSKETQQRLEAMVALRQEDEELPEGIVKVDDDIYVPEEVYDACVEHFRNMHKEVGVDAVKQEIVIPFKTSGPSDSLTMDERRILRTEWEGMTLTWDETDKHLIIEDGYSYFEWTGLGTDEISYSGCFENEDVTERSLVIDYLKEFKLPYTLKESTVRLRKKLTDFFMDKITAPSNGPKTLPTESEE